MRAMFATDAMDHHVYTSIMSVLIELRAGYPYDDEDFCLEPEGGYTTYRDWFPIWGVKMPFEDAPRFREEDAVDLQHLVRRSERIAGMTRTDPVDLTIQEEIEMDEDDIETIVDDLTPLSYDLNTGDDWVTQGEWTVTQLCGAPIDLSAWENDLMNEEIGEFDGSETFTDEGFVLSDSE